ncbi:cofilin [Tulasnella sp. 419]|nr:cofilin [Tulasnella sp. 418]KAG8961319.1 cofilin [Tulasnella sp. 419]
MSSGVGVNPECLEKYQELKLGKKLKYIIFALNKTNTEIVVDKTSQNADYDEFLESLPEDEPRYAVYDFEYDKGDEGKRNKIVFVSWSPDNSRIKQKMVYSSSKEAIRRGLVGIGAEVQGTDTSEVGYDAVLEKVNRR